MQARQETQILDRIVEHQQQTALTLERVLGRLDAVERWQQNEDRAKERAEERKDDRIEKAPDSRRADMALLVSGAMFAFYLITFLAQHWRP